MMKLPLNEMFEHKDYDSSASQLLSALIFQDNISFEI